jgi:hypothetical protein
VRLALETTEVIKQYVKPGDNFTLI